MDMQVFKGKLTRLLTNPDALKSEDPLRTDEINGYCLLLPKEGSGFMFVGPPYTAVSGLRQICTSKLVEVMQMNESTFEFKTMNSHYRLELETKGEE